MAGTSPGMTKKQKRPGGDPGLFFVIASEAKQSRATRTGWIASSQVLLAMTAL
jgi:hypothetical protein